MLFLNGGFGTMLNWDRVIQRLAGKYRTIRFDARARGKSSTSADYSVFATTPYNHMQILNKAPDTVVAAIEDVIHQSSC